LSKSGEDKSMEEVVEATRIFGEGIGKGEATSRDSEDRRNNKTCEKNVDVKPIKNNLQAWK